jgi:hypothetical protein
MWVVSRGHLHLSSSTMRNFSRMAGPLGAPSGLRRCESPNQPAACPQRDVLEESSFPRGFVPIRTCRTRSGNIYAGSLDQASVTWFWSGCGERDMGFQRERKVRKKKGGPAKPDRREEIPSRSPSGLDRYWGPNENLVLVSLWRWFWHLPPGSWLLGVSGVSGAEPLAS